MLKVRIRLVKRTGLWTAYHASHRAAEYGTQDEAFEAEVSALSGAREAWDVRLTEGGSVTRQARGPATEVGGCSFYR